MRRQLGYLAVPLAACAALTGCTPPDAALKVTVTLKSQGTTRVRADCIKLAVLQDTVEKKSITVKRPADDTLVFAVLRGTDLPASVNLQVSGFLGKCDDESTLQLNAQGGLEPANFPESGVLPFELSLDPPGVALDADRDGFVSAAKGGPDCRDDDNTIFPGASQVCSSQVDTDCDGALGCDDDGCNSATFCLDQADRVVLTPMARTMNRGDCMGPVRVELYNAVGPRKAVRDTPVSFTSSITGVTVHSTANCGDMAITSFPILFDTTFVDVYLKADETAFGTNTFTATASRVTMPGTTTVEVHPRPVSGIRFTNQPLSLNAGVCGATPVTLEFFDAMNQPTAVDTPATINLSALPLDMMNNPVLFSDANCTTLAPSVSLQPGQGTATLYVLAKLAGMATITAAPSIGTPATQNYTVAPGTPDHLKFHNMVLALVTNMTCSPAVLELQLQDRYDNLAVLPDPLSVTMSVMGPAPVQFFQTSNCNVALTDFTLPANTSTLNIQAGSMGTGSGTSIKATANISVPPIAAATQPILIAAGPASTFVWNGQPQTTLAGVCSANPISIELRDTANNTTSSLMPLNFSLSTSPAADVSFRFFSGAGCATDLNGIVTIPTGQTSAQIYFRGNRVASNFTINATSTLTPPSTMFTGNSILPNVPAKLSFGAPTVQTAQAGSCTASQYVVNVLDTYDNPTVFTSAQSVTVSSNPAGVTVGAAPACAGNSVMLPAMTGSASFTAKHTVTSPVTPYQLSATVSGFSTSSAASLTVTPGPPSLIVDLPAGGNSTRTAGVCQDVTLSRRDMFNNNAPTSGNNNVALTFPNGTQWDLYLAQGCMGTAGGTVTMNNTHTTTFSLRPKTAGMHMVQASVAGTNAVINFTVAPATPTLVFETPNTGLGTAAAAQNAGGCTPVTIARKDTYGNDVPLGSAQNVTFTLPTGTTIHPDSSCAMAGITTIALTAADVRTTFYVKATVSAPTGGPAPQNVSAILGGQTATLTLTVSPATAMANLVAPAGAMANVAANLACVTVTVERRDAFNNLVPVPGGTTSMTVTGPTAMNAYDSSNCTGTAIVQSPAGTSTVAVTAGSSSKTFSVRNTTASSATITPTLAGLTYPFTLTVTPGPLTVYLIEGLSSPITAGACSGAMQVRRRDNFSNDIVNDPPQTVTLNSAVFSFSSTASTCTPSMTGPFNVNIPTGSAVSTTPFYVTGTNAVATTIGASGGGGSGTLNVTVSPAAASSINFVTAATTGTAGACLTGSFSVDLRDMYNNQVRPSSAYAVTLGAAPTGTFGAGAACAGGAVNITSAQPVATFSYLPITSGMNVITASGAGPLSSTTNVNVSAGTANTLVWRTNPTASPARFACVSAGVIESRDGNNNLSAVGGALTVNLVTTAPSVTFFSDSSCATAPITSTTIPMGNDATPQLYMFTTGTAADISATATSFTGTPTRTITPTGANGVLVVTPPTPDLEAGACIAMTVERQDNTPATLTTGNTALTISVPSNQGVSLYTTSDCSGAAANSLNRTIANMASTTTIYARGRSASTGATPNNVTLTASALGSNDGTTALKVYPLVRRGACNLTATNATSRCAVSPPIPMKDLSRSFLLFSSTGRPATTSPNAMAASDQNVACALDNTNADVEVVCTRGGINGGMTIQYQVVSFGRDAASGNGISVQHYPNVATSTSGATTTQTITTAVDTSKSFIIASSNYTDTLNNGEGFPLVKFQSTGASVSSVDIVSNTAAPTTRFVSFQVVTLGFATSNVIHSNANLPTVGTSNNYVITTASTTVANTFALGMAQVADGTNPETMCRRRFNTRVASATTLTLHRATATQPMSCTDAQSTVSAISTQRVFWPNATVNSFDVTFGNNTTASQSTSQFTAAVAQHKSVCFLQTQGPGGQASGEANFTGSGADGDDTGPFHAMVDFNGTSDRVVVTREASVNTISTFSPVVVQFDP